MNSFNNIQYHIDKTMLEDGGYSAVVAYLNGKKDDRLGWLVF